MSKVERRPRRKVRSKVSEKYDVVVVGGGLAGVCAAIAAARHGCRTALVQDRPVLGGVSSSEIRVAPGGANNLNGWARETGIVEELQIEERARNHEFFRNGAINSQWDLVLYEWVKREENLTLFLNTVVNSVEKDKKKGAILAVSGAQAGSERSIRLRARFFVDATGDGTVGALAGAEFRFGREARSEFDESLAPDKADLQTMGSSLLFRARDMGRPVPFVPPPWAEKYPTDESLAGRVPGKFNGKEYAGYWWIEVGVPYDTIDQNEEIRDEALRHLLGVWDHIKNHGDHGAENMGLDWIGMVPGKRESRRLMGDYLLTLNDILANVPFPDRVLYGGWFVDIHTMGGILAKGQPGIPRDGLPTTNPDTIVRTYSVPYRCLYSRNIGNLFMAGRDISVTHCALGTTRLMLTCAMMGQVVGTAAGLAKKRRTSPRGVGEKHIQELQQLLVKDDAFILDMPNQDPADLARTARVSGTSSAALSLDPDEGATPLSEQRAQIFPVSGDRIDTLSLHLQSKANSDIEMEIGVAPVDDIWDFRVPGEDEVVRAKATVPAASSGWVAFNLSANVRAGQLYQVVLPVAKGISWTHARPVPGVCSATKPPDWSRWRGIKPTFALCLDPPSAPFGPDSVVNGVARPERWPNLWMSDPSEPLPQSLVLQWDKPQEFNTVYLTFDTYLHQETSALPPFWRAKECVKDYRVEADVRGKWRVLAEESGNYHRRRIHRFRSVRSQKLKITVLATNGDPSARIYEVRIYQEESVSQPESVSNTQRKHK